MALATARGLKGFSVIVQEALDHYLANEAARTTRTAAALGVLDTLEDSEADALSDSVHRSRESWRIGAEGGER